MELPQTVPSPITGRPSRLERKLSATTSVKAYSDRFGYDASRYFTGLAEFGVYGCDTGFRFYYPFTLAGDESLYRCLQQFDWNYQDDKWEYRASLPHVREADKVLDVGCGEGKFLEKVKARGAQAFGIELNKQAAAMAASKGIEPHEELLSAHDRPDFYDVVTSFQVLEHVTDPLDFVRGCVRVLRPGGILIIGVPNDDGFLRLDHTAVLNQPPHHMGLWNRKSLTALAGIVGLEVQAFEVEPLAEHGWFQSVVERTYLSRWQRWFFHRLGLAKAFASYIEENAHTIAGHTILAIYRKPRAGSLPGAV